MNEVTRAEATAAARWCGRCGEPESGAPHPGCAAALTLEPPRFCTACRRRMKVQVLPGGWRASCVAHGELTGA
ncbi:hypothetical protein JQS43_09455 [Natronosporangium hydrolyticum]|uniref:Biotin synthase auxiliary protein n=1 Tax=Natronosporangium hydrolyticum TaxID=2811111 RepID=A0A895YLX5_9ACTN|nr:hypothetical protein [Natronosporangium hydrolyticum]QSB16479.1 hypothetical protein JQS43_09455 [Natronosporangium hydrolyticum]